MVTGSSSSLLSLAHQSRPRHDGASPAHHKHDGASPAHPRHDGASPLIPPLQYKDGFPQTEEYGTPVMICDTVPGVLTIDSEGAENGGDAAVTVREVYGGDVRVSIRVGNVDIIQTACTTFVGEYDLLTGAGSVGVRVDEAEIGTYLVDVSAGLLWSMCVLSAWPT